MFRTLPAVANGRRKPKQSETECEMSDWPHSHTTKVAWCSPCASVKTPREESLPYVFHAKPSQTFARTLACSHARTRTRQRAFLHDARFCVCIHAHERAHLLLPASFCAALTVSPVILILAIVQDVIWACPDALSMLFALDEFAVILAFAVQNQLTLAVGQSILILRVWCRSDQGDSVLSCAQDRHGQSQAGR